MKQFSELKSLLINIEDLRLIEPNVFLAPFLEVIRSEETTGQITSLALSALNKFLSYGLIGKPIIPTNYKLNQLIYVLVFTAFTQIQRIQRLQQPLIVLPMQ